MGVYNLTIADFKNGGFEKRIGLPNSSGNPLVTTGQNTPKNGKTLPDMAAPASHLFSTSWLDDPSPLFRPPLTLPVTLNRPLLPLAPGSLQLLSALLQITNIFSTPSHKKSHP